MRSDSPLPLAQQNKFTILRLKTLKTVFYRLSKHLEFHRKYSAARVFSSLFSVSEYPDETLSLVFDILLKTPFSFVVSVVLNGRLLHMSFLE